MSITFQCNLRYQALTTRQVFGTMALLPLKSCNIKILIKSMAYNTKPRFFGIMQNNCCAFTIACQILQNCSATPLKWLPKFPCIKYLNEVLYSLVKPKCIKIWEIGANIWNLRCLFSQNANFHFYNLSRWNDMFIFRSSYVEWPHPFMHF